MDDLPEHGITPVVVARESGAETTGVNQDMIDSAVATVRGLVGWHVWPVREETLLLDGTGGRIVFLPTKRLVEVLEVVVDGTTVDGSSIQQSVDGIIELPRSPRGLGLVKATIRHGYDMAPDLRRVCIQMAARSSRPQESTTVGRISIGAPAGMAPQSAEWRVIDLYKLGPMP